MSWPDCICPARPTHRHGSEDTVAGRLQRMSAPRLDGTQSLLTFEKKAEDIDGITFHVAASLVSLKTPIASVSRRIIVGQTFVVLAGRQALLATPVVGLKAWEQRNNYLLQWCAAQGVEP
eukprot:scaffold92136_cov46-Prasinocladus_malaysianus.AAC.1